jgi:hypothetical protein
VSPPDGVNGDCACIDAGGLFVFTQNALRDEQREKSPDRWAIAIESRGFLVEIAIAADAPGLGLDASDHPR